VSDDAYPLATHARAELVSRLTLEAATSGELGPADTRIAPETLHRQARFAEQGGNPQLAENLRRGAELTGFDDDQLLGFYELLRPGRATAAELEQLAAKLEEGGAARCAALVREAQAAYQRRGLIA
jgi:propanediol dehydratase small subunit